MPADAVITANSSLPVRPAIRRFYKETMVVVHSDRLSRVPKGHNLPFTNTGELSLAQSFLLITAVREVRQL